MSDKEDALILEGLSVERKKEVLKELGLTPKLPSIIALINDHDLYSTKDVAEFLKFTPQHVTRLCRHNELNAIQAVPGGAYKIFGEQLKLFLNKSFHRKGVIKKLSKKFLND